MDHSVSQAPPLPVQSWQFQAPQLGQVNLSIEDTAQGLMIALQAGDQLQSLFLRGDSAQVVEDWQVSGTQNSLAIRLGLLQLLDVGFAVQPQVLEIKITDTIAASLPVSIQWQGVLNRAAFYQWAELYMGQYAQAYPLAQRWVETNGVRHPLRPLQPFGEFYRRFVPAIGKSLSFRTINPDTDLGLFHRWMNHPAIAPIWELGKPKEELHEYLRRGEQDPHIISILGCFDDEPFGYFELYWTLEDRLGPYYDAQPFDRGLHLLVGNRRYLGDRFFDAWMNGLTHYLYLDDPRTQHVYGEPRADNVKLKRHVMRFNCWTHIKDFDFPHKRAALLQCNRDRFFEGANLK